MDGLLSQLRSSSNPTDQQTTKRMKNREETNSQSIKDESPPTPPDPALPPEGLDIVMDIIRKGPSVEEEVLEITTSQAENDYQGHFEPNFDLISHYRTSSSITALQLKRATELKIYRSFYCFIKTVIPMGDIFRWELYDETGTICGSSTVNASPGTLVCLRDFSLWRICENHINILKENVTEVSQIK